MESDQDSWFNAERILQSVYGKELPPVPKFRKFLQEASERIVKPLALQIVDKVRESREKLVDGERPNPYVQGILGLQGTGKTTLSELVVKACELGGLKGFAVSIDDFYLSYAARQELRSKEPLLRRRGPPGTHDHSLLDRFIADLDDTNRPTIRVPRFDKAPFRGEGDQIPAVELPRPDFVIFEGWFLGARPPSQLAASSEFATPLTPIVDAALKAYFPLWARFNSLVGLIPKPFSLSREWRVQAEAKLREEKGSGMTDAEVRDFVDFFWQALHPERYVRPLLETGGALDGYVFINEDREILEAYGIFA